MSKFPGLGRQNGGPWGLRRHVPDVLRPIIGKWEIWRSYRTDSYEEAKQRHYGEMAKVDALFQKARLQLEHQLERDWLKLTHL